MIRFKSIYHRLLFWFLLLGLLPLTLTLGLIYTSQYQDIKINTYSKLVAIRNLKVRELNNWMNERIGDISTLSKDLEIRKLEFSKDAVSFSEDYSGTKDEIRKHLFTHLDHSQTYKELFMVSTTDGRVFVSTNPENEGLLCSDNSYFTEPLRTNNTYIKDIYYSNNTHSSEMTISAPVYCLNQKMNTSFIIVARFDLHNSLYPILLDRTGLGETGETLIVNSEGMALNELRWSENAPLNLKITALPAKKASEGESGIIETKDYRGVKVLAAYAHIPLMKWGFVSKMDNSEVFKPIMKMIRLFLIIFFSSVILIIILARHSARTISAPIQSMQRTAEEFQQGNFTARNENIGFNEVGKLALAFNSAADTIEERISIQDYQNKINQAAIELDIPEEFSSNLLNQLIELSGSSSAIFFALHNDDVSYIPIANIGINKKDIPLISSGNMMGELENALYDKKIHVIRNIDPQTDFIFRTSYGDAIPREICSIPLLSGDKVIGIISMCSLSSFSDEFFEFIESTRNVIAVAYSNLRSVEKMQVMTDDLKNSNEKLENQARILQTQSEELQAQTEELQQQSEELQEQNLNLINKTREVQEANRLKSEFLSNMSHELRTPLNSIMALSHVLIQQADNKISDDELNYLQIIERNGKSLLNLINDILDISKIESGKINLNPERLNIKHLLAELKENFQQIVNNKQLDFNIQTDNNISELETDKQRLFQVLINVTSNAVKFTDSGEVSISVSQDDKYMNFEISDTGVGIPEDQLDLIFEKFRQVDGSPTRKHEGTGLGLSIVKELIDILGGKLKIESEINKGSKFLICIPLKWHGVNTIPFESAKEVNSDKNYENCILVIDDNANVRTQICSILKKQGYNTIEAKNGMEGLQLAAKYRPFAITLDIIMPDLDGWEVLQRLKQIEETRHIPIIVISITDDKETASALGAHGFMQLPLDKDEFVRKIITVKKPSETKNTTPKLLIIEDNKDISKQIQILLGDEDININKAENGKTALDFLMSNTTDGIILDIMMPEMDGFSFLKKLRANPELSWIKVLVLSAKDFTKEEYALLKDMQVNVILQKGNIVKNSFKSKVLSMLGIIKESENYIPESKKSQRKTPIAIKSVEKANILVIEDNPDNMVAVKAILGKEYIIHEASNGNEAINMVQNLTPDIILLDMALPDMDGLEILDKLKKISHILNVPVIALTAKAMKEDRIKFLNAGCNEYVSKPIDQNDLLKKIKMFVIS